MSAQGLNRSVQFARVWIDELDDRLRWNNKARSYDLLKSVLHALRDSLRVNEAVELGARLPGLLRGAYYEQWQPGTTPSKSHDTEELLRRVNETFKRDPLPEPSLAVMAVFQLLSEKMMEGAIGDGCHCLPGAVPNIWSESYGTFGTVRH